MLAWCPQCQSLTQQEEKTRAGVPRKKQRTCSLCGLVTQVIPSGVARKIDPPYTARPYEDRLTVDGRRLALIQEDGWV